MNKRKVIESHPYAISVIQIDGKPIKSIEALQLREYLQKTIIDEKLGEQAYKNLKMILRETFAHAVEHKYILTNLMKDLTVSTVNLAKPKKKAREEVVFTIKERDLLRDYITKDSGNYTDTAPYAILLSFQLGLRVGELVALKWSDISKGTIHIQRQEVIYDVYDDDLNKTKSSVHEVVEYTKTQIRTRKHF